MDRCTVVCIDNYADRTPTGCIWDPFLHKEIPFRGLMDFLLRMEDRLGQAAQPKGYLSFDTGQRLTPIPGQGAERRGRLATFTVRVIFRQNASWQGSVSWLEQKREQSFRSVLELALLMDSALAQNGEEKEKRVSAFV